MAVFLSAETGLLAGKNSSALAPLLSTCADSRCVRHANPDLTKAHGLLTSSHRGWDTLELVFVGIDGGGSRYGFFGRTSPEVLRILF